MPDARTESQSPTPATGPAQDPGRPPRPRPRRRKKPAGTTPVGAGASGDVGEGKQRGGGASADVAELAARLDGLTAADREQLGRRLERLRGLREPEKRQGALSEIAARIEQAEQRVEQRRLAMPEISYPEELPVSQLKDEIAAAIRDHQVVVIAGETGSGKTTQIPKICLELGRGVRGMIGHTQAAPASPHVRSPSGSPKNSGPNWARPSATRSASPIR